MRVVVVCVFVCLGSTTQAFAQSAYVGAALIGDLIRSSGSGYGDDSNTGETFGGALRVGAPLGDRWGVELEFVRSGEIESEPDVSILREIPASLIVGIGDIGLYPNIFPPPQIRISRQLSTLSPVLWWNQRINDRFALVYLGGVSFTRNEVEYRTSYDFPIPLPVGGVPLPVTRPIFQSSVVSYGADVTVGMEGRLGMTEHVRLTPGIRMQTIPGGWAIRPGVGLAWMF